VDSSDEGDVSPPAWLHTTSFSSSTQSIAIAIKEVAPGRWHTGILFRDEDEPLVGRFLHLAFHWDLRNNVAGVRESWVEVDLDDELKSSIAAMCRNIWLQNEIGQRIGYGPRHTMARFNPDGVLNNGGDCGLTCATFVHALFRDAGALLLDLASWPERPDDEAFKAWVVEELGTRGVDDEYIQRVRAEPRSARLRPPEVAGAGAVSSRPASFVQARVAADEIEVALASPQQATPIDGVTDS
jgi:hypothetical protein